MNLVENIILMAANSDRQKFDNAMDKWQNFYREGNFSAPTDEGSIAILCSYDLPNCSGRFSRKDKIRERRNLKNEAEWLGKSAVLQGRRPRVILDFGYEEMEGVLKDPHVSDVIVIGHGNLSGVFIKDEPRGGFFDWVDVSVSANHLKQGYFIQRHCGGYGRDLSVPLGTFAVTDFVNVHAAPGQNISPDNPDHPDHTLLRPVFSKGVIPTYSSIKVSFPHTPRFNSYPVAFPPPNASGLVI